MTPNTFWKFFLKIFALYLIWQILTIIPSFVSNLISSVSQDKGALFTVFAGALFVVLLFTAIVRYCLFQTDRVIDKLHLEKGFPDEKLEINIHRSSLLSIAIIILGGVMLADALPLLIANIFSYIQGSDNTIKFRDNHATPYLIAYFLKVVIGYFLVADSRLVVNFIERKRKKSIIAAEDVAE
ncbi:hypothetical protein HDF24_08685 [Mucilaginibacter sp. X4EP1]|uniref:hypothetical protein n=1 Tax=Mucilaginibacter sp. X4EP1 TaxID=2723092 RepID=UPI0021681F4D|nr:hypothetical protein [Mucilaginibacter sp. X4EP1]MCS3813744.1 hypothetical protein [Mucilaginibacter sp. X4EP1]